MMQTTSFILRQSVVVWVRTSGLCKSLHLSDSLSLNLYIYNISLSVSVSVSATHTQAYGHSMKADRVLDEWGQWTLGPTFPLDISWLESFHAMLFASCSGQGNSEPSTVPCHHHQGVTLCGWFLDLWYRGTAWHCEATTPEFMSNNIQSFKVPWPPLCQACFDVFFRLLLLLSGR